MAPPSHRINFTAARLWRTLYDLLFVYAHTGLPFYQQFVNYRYLQDLVTAHLFKDYAECLVVIVEYADFKYKTKLYNTYLYLRRGGDFLFAAI